MLKSILEKAKKGETLSREEGLCLLHIDNHSSDFYSLIDTANGLSRREYNNKGYIFAQIGLNSQPCTGNCRFCSIAKDNFALSEMTTKSESEVLSEVDTLIGQPVDALFLMTTADYPVEDFIAIAKKVKARLPKEMAFVANIGDFDKNTGDKLKAVGFTGIYHIVRLNEGIDTDLPVAQRLATLDAVLAAGLELYYCVEPIGTEHTYEQIVEEMLRARDYHVDVMAVMRRVGVAGTQFFGTQEVTELEMTKIVAVARLVTRPKRSMNVHEPMKMPLLAGVNQLYAEIGFNPRDTQSNTEKNRGFTVDKAVKMLKEAEYKV